MSNGEQQRTCEGPRYLDTLARSGLTTEVTGRTYRHNTAFANASSCSWKGQPTKFCECFTSRDTSGYAI
ncbi:hypothetical protein AB1Y20_009970 [Prymnesium parvum]|uniref:Phospholipase B-like n=1 Tax=Prymnesium parvum TaxID=97485 RepID=A0AB34K625_PRYPA